MKTEEISFLTEESDIAFEDCKVKMEYHYQSQSGLRAGSADVSLQDLFITIATEMMEVSISEPLVEKAIKIKFLSGKKVNYFDDRELYWGLTNKGRKIRDDAILIRNS